MGELDIAQVARYTGLPAATLRYYERRGLIAAIGRHGLRRVFDASVLERLALIALGHTAGFSLDEIAAMVGPHGAPRIDRRRLVDKADALERTIRRLEKLREGLRHAAACRAPSHLECPTFQRIMRVSARKRTAKRR